MNNENTMMKATVTYGFDGGLLNKDSVVSLKIFGRAAKRCLVKEFSPTSIDLIDSSGNVTTVTADEVKSGVVLVDVLKVGLLN